MADNLRIVNVIASTTARGKIDLEHLAQVLINVQYEPRVFPGLIYRKSGKPTIIMFATGKITSSGAKTESEAKEAILNTLKEIEHLGCLEAAEENLEIRIINVVATGDLHHSIDLESYAMRLNSCIYEPEQFPGLILRFNNSSIVSLVFSTGKIVLAGAKSKKDVEDAFNQLAEIVN